MRSILAALFFIGLAGGASADVAVTVWAGAGGTVRQGSTVPVIVQLQNDDRERAGVVRVGFALQAWPVSWAVQPMDLAPRARKRVTLYLPLATFADRIVVRYETPGGRRIVAHEEQLIVVPGTTPMVAAVGEWPRGLPEPQQDNYERFRPAILQPEQLPGRFEGLEMFDAILLTPMPERAFTNEQAEALSEWVLRGGTLVVDASERTDALQTDAFRDLLPFVPVTLEQSRLPGFLQPLAYASGEVREGETLLEAEGRPLVARRNLGLGSVVCFAFEPGDAALLEGGRAESLWREVLGSIEFDEPDWNTWQDSLHDTTSYLIGRVTEFQQTPLRLGIVVLLMLVYALVVGPGDYYLVKWLRRPRLTWLTFPLMAIGFTVAAYAGARVWFGGETTSAAWRRVVVFPEQEQAIVFDVSGLFAGHGGDYELRHAEGAMLRHLQSPYDPEKSVTVPGDTGVLLQRIPVWTQRAYAAQYTTDEYPAVDVRLADDGKTAVVVNRSELELRDCRVTTAVAQGTCGGVAPGGSATVELQPVEQERPADAESQGPFDPSYPQQPIMPVRLDAPFAREMFAVKDALRRGAVVLDAKTGANTKNALVVNGRRRTEQANLELGVVTYGRGD